MRGRPPKGTVRNTMLKVRLTAEEMETLDSLAMTTGRTKSDLVRKALQNYIEKVNVNEKHVEENLETSGLESHD